MGDNARELTPKQKRFVEEYLVDLNASQAAIRAGYSPKNANVDGSRLLANAGIKTLIDAALEEKSKETKVDADRIVTEIHRLATLDATLLIDETGKMKAPKDWPPEIRSAVAALEFNADGTVKRVRFWNKNQALELAAQYHKLFQRVEQHLHLHAIPPQQLNAIADMRRDQLEDMVIDLIERHARNSKLALPAPKSAPVHVNGNGSAKH